MLQAYADQIGVPEVLMLSSYPIGLLNYYLTNPTIRLWYGLLSGFLLQYLMYGFDCIHIILATTLTYLFLLFFGRKLSAFWVLTLTVFHLSVLHIYRMLNDWGGWKLDSTTIYMMSICKFSNLAFSYEDGGKSDGELKSSYHRSKKIVEIPTTLETFSYVFYFPSAVVGPSFEFADFRQFINLQGPFKSIPMFLAIKNAFQELFKSLINIFIFLIFEKTFNLKYNATEEFGNQSFLYKFVYFNLSMSVQRAKYYGGWKMAQSAIVFCGLGYNPVVENSTPEAGIVHKFDRVENCIIREIEIDPNPKRRIQYWNRTVHLWLKYNLYLRLLNVENKTFKNNRGLASLITFIVSAFWHGFYPIYYIFFFLFFIVEQICTILEEDYNFFKYMDSQNIVIRYLFSFFTMSFQNYLGIIFVLVDLKKAINFFAYTYFSYPIMLLSLYFYVKRLHLIKKKKEYREKKEKEMMKTTPEGPSKKIL